MSAGSASRDRPADTIAGFLAATAIFVALISVVYRPLRLDPPALLLALLATAIGGRSSRLAALAVGVGAACFFFGMVVAVVTSHPLY